MLRVSTISRRRALALAGAIALAPAGPAAADQAARVLTEAVPTIPGPRRTVGVGAFDLVGPMANASATNVGGPVAALLETALSECDCVILTERDAVAQMVTEMELAKSGVTAGNAAPRPGGMLPVQYLIVGSITNYTATGPGSGSGGGFSIGGSTALTLGGSSGSVGIDLRIIDTRTGVVIKAFKVHRKLSSTNLGLSTGFKGVPVATNGFFNTPLGDATRKAMNDAVIQIAQALAAIPWRGQVVKADGDVIYVNAGAEAGVKVGDQMHLERVGESLTDPATGAVLKETMVELGVVTITTVEPRLATGSYRRILDGQPARGDFVVLQN